MVNYGSLYKTYQQKMYDAKRSSKLKHLPMNWDESLNKEDFKNYFEATKASLMERGQKPSNTEVINAMVDKQRFGISEKQGLAIQKAMAARGKKEDLTTIRAYAGLLMEDEFETISVQLRKMGSEVKAFYDEVKEFYWKKKTEGYAVESILTLISQVYFGSP